MIIKIVTLFLVGMGVLAMFGKFRIPMIGRRMTRFCTKCGTKLDASGKCPNCKKGRG